MKKCHGTIKATAVELIISMINVLSGLVKELRDKSLALPVNITNLSYDMETKIKDKTGLI